MSSWKYLVGREIFVEMKQDDASLEVIKARKLKYFDCSHEIKRRLLLETKPLTDLVQSSR